MATEGDKLAEQTRQADERTAANQRAIERHGLCDVRTYGAPGTVPPAGAPTQRPHCWHVYGSSMPAPDPTPDDPGRYALVTGGMCCFCAPPGIMLEVAIRGDDAEQAALRMQHGPRLKVVPLAVPNTGRASRIVVPGNGAPAMPPGIPFPPDVRGGGRGVRQ